MYNNSEEKKLVTVVHNWNYHWKLQLARNFNQTLEGGGINRLKESIKPNQVPTKDKELGLCETRIKRAL